MTFPTMREAFATTALADHKRRIGSPLHSSVQRALASVERQRKPRK